jgi:hypothetical protein
MSKDDLLNCWTSSSDVSGYHADFHEEHGMSEQGRGTAWARHAMCESALRLSSRLKVTSHRCVYTSTASPHAGMSSGTLGLGITLGAVNFMLRSMTTERDPDIH